MAAPISSPTQYFHWNDSIASRPRHIWDGSRLSAARGIAERAQQRQQRAIERCRDMKPLASGDDGAGQGLDFEFPSRQTIEVHRGARLGWISKKRRYGAHRFVFGQLRAIGARPRPRLIEAC